MILSVHELAYQCLMENEPAEKVKATQSLYRQIIDSETISRDNDSATPVTIQVPGRPEKPELVNPKSVKHRKLTTPEGRAGLVHAVAHIEFNAINLALDAVYRFRGMPDQYYRDWLLVASEESKHFGLLENRLKSMSCDYGDFPAHNGLWEMSVRTDHDV